MTTVMFLLDKSGISESMLLERREEDVLFRHYERRLMDFCNAFKPAMPKSVVVCALLFLFPRARSARSKLYCVIMCHQIGQIV